MKRGKIIDEKYAIKYFEEYKIMTKWDPEIEDYYYSVIDSLPFLVEVEILEDIGLA